MRITDVDVIPVRGRHWPRFPMVFVEVHTDQGLVGVGEALPYQATGLVGSLRELGEALRGADPFRIQAHWERFFRRGATMPALSALETAMWDLVGQALGTPVYQLLGGACRDRIHVYADGFFREGEPTPQAYAEKAREAVDGGLDALKMDVDEFLAEGKRLDRGLQRSELRSIVETVSAVRAAVGEGVQLGLDCHWAFDVAAATRLGHALEPFELMWLEDPIPSGNAAALARLRAEVAVSICTGEVLETRYAFRELLERGAADVLMPDLARTGGILETMRIAALADTYYVSIAPHNMMGPVATAASVQLCACIPNFRILEYQLDDVPWRDEIVEPPLTVADGYLTLPDGPGIGMRLNHAALGGYVIS
jgi:galactonate dehydratase